MSEGARFTYQWAWMKADTVLRVLEPECERIAIAGSLRRKKKTIGDVEIVLIPKPAHDLFDGEVFGSMRIEAAIIRQEVELIKNGQFLKTFELPDGLKFEIYLTTPEKWGCIFTIRTGSADFSHKLVTKRRDGGFCPSNLHFKDGRIWNGDQVLDTPEEIDVFNALNMEWIEPELREVNV